MKRGGGRRYYRPADLELLRGIRRLLQAEGYSVRGVQKILRKGGADDVKRMGREHSGERRVRSRPRSPAAPVVSSPGAASPPLSATDVGLLRDVVAELVALQAMLRDVEGGKGADA
jgi:DNA-binding transcriptional MerR regulator